MAEITLFSGMGSHQLPPPPSLTTKKAGNKKTINCMIADSIVKLQFYTNGDFISYSRCMFVFKNFNWENAFHDFIILFHKKILKRFPPPPSFSLFFSVFFIINYFRPRPIKNGKGNF